MARVGRNTGQQLADVVMRPFEQLEKNTLAVHQQTGDTQLGVMVSCRGNDAGDGVFVQGR